MSVYSIRYTKCFLKKTWLHRR